MIFGKDVDRCCQLCEFGFTDEENGTVKCAKRRNKAFEPDHKCKKFAGNTEFKRAFNNEELYRKNKKCRVYRMLLKIKAYGLMHLIAVLVAKKRSMS